MSIEKINSGLPTTTKIETLNSMIIEADGKITSAKFDKNELDQLYDDLGINRKYLRNVSLGNTLATYSNWTHVQAENGYSIWKFAPSNYSYNANNEVYFDGKALINKGSASSESASTFDSVLSYEGSTYTNNSSEAGIVDGTEFEVLTSTSDYLYIGHSAQFSGAKIEFHTRASNNTLKFEYYNGSSWVEITANTNDLVDNTNNFQGDGRFNWDATTITDWATVAVNSITKYWIRVSTTTTPVTNAKIYYLIPDTSVVGLLALNSDDVIAENWAFCSYNGYIYATIRNTGNSLYDGDYYINSSSSVANLKNFFIYNHEFTADYLDSTYTASSVSRLNAPDASPDSSGLNNSEVTFWLDESSGGPTLMVKMKTSDGSVTEEVVGAGGVSGVSGIKVDESGYSEIVGHLTFTAGANVSLLQVGNNIEISSTSSGVTSLKADQSGTSNLTGAVTLSAGSNITLNQVGNDIEITAVGGASATRATFTNASLSAGVLTITHNLGLSAPYSVIIAIFNNSSQQIIPDQVTGSTNSVAIDLTSYGTLTGTWGYAYIAG